jgi:uncharacterized protein with HEPN domain
MSEAERNLSILEHIIRYCDQIDEAIQRFGDDGQVFRSDAVYQNAVAMCLLQIGELAGHLTDEYRATHLAIPWRQIKALRNIIAHNYGSVDAETAWEIVQDDIPTLRAYCEKETQGTLT